MSELQRQVALSSGKAISRDTKTGKTISRKAKNKAAQQAKSLGNLSVPSSQANSRAGSRAGSVAGSRANSAANSRAGSVSGSRANSGDEVSEDERDFFNQPSRREEVDLDDFDDEESLTGPELIQERIDKLLDKKKKGVDEREQDLHKYNQVLLSMDAKDDVAYQQSEIIQGLVKTIKGARTEKETTLALKGIALTTITNPNNVTFSEVRPTLIQLMKDSPTASVKSSAINTLSLCAFFGGADSTSTTALIGFLSTIVSTDGSSISARDSGPVVTTALNSLSFLLTSIEDAESLTSELMPSLVDQLDSTEPDVQISAAEGIALLYEKSWVEVPNEYGDGTVQESSYQVYSDHRSLCAKLKEVGSGSRRHLNKRDKKNQHQALLDVLHSVENPGTGPRYSEAMDKDKNVYGSRMTLKVRGKQGIKVDKWWCYVRLKFLKAVLGGGWGVCVENCGDVWDCLVNE